MSDLNVGQAQDRLAFLVEAGMLLASSIDLEVTLRNVARLAVPRLADWCAVYRVEADGDVTELIAEHTDPSRQELLARLRKEYPPDSENPTAHRKVVVTGQPEHYPEITPELIRITARDETHAALLAELGLLSLVSVPLVVENRIWGAISIATDESSGRRLGEGDLSLAVEIAARAGMTIENSLLLREVAEKRRLFQITLASIGDAVIACDCDGTITFINGAAEHLTGCDSDLACGGPASGVVTIMSGGAPQPIEDLVARVIVEREEVELPPDAVVVARNGERAPVSGGLSPIVDEERGTIAGVVIVLHDVSAIRESELALRESRTRFRLVSDSITSHAIITLTPEGAIDSWNTGAEEIFGYSKDDAVGLNVRVLFTPEDQVLGVSEKEMREAGERGYANDDRWMMRASGERFFANGVTTPITDERGWLRGYVKVLQDYTDRKLMQEEVERARMRAEEASHAKSHFLATLSHELRTPLTPVLTAVQMLCEDERLGEDQKGLLAMIERNVEVEARLIDDLLDITRISSGKLQFHMDRIDVHEAVRAALDVCAGQVRAKEHLVVVELEAGRHHVVGDAARLQQVFWNLITNAVKFTPTGGVITIESRNDGGTLCVTVRDTGIGIEPDLLSKVFTVFEQGDVSITKRFGGLGLGLSISRAIVEALGGDIRADSEGRGMGTVFTVELPAEE